MKIYFELACVPVHVAFSHITYLKQMDYDCTIDETVGLMRVYSVSNRNSHKEAR